jgi:hypothetical protein
LRKFNKSLAKFKFIIKFFCRAEPPFLVTPSPLSLSPRAPFPCRPEPPFLSPRAPFPCHPERQRGVPPSGDAVPSASEGCLAIARHDRLEVVTTSPFLSPRAFFCHLELFLPPRAPFPCHPEPPFLVTPSPLSLSPRGVSRGVPPSCPCHSEPLFCHSEAQAEESPSHDQRGMPRYRSLFFVSPSEARGLQLSKRRFLATLEMTK